MDGFASIADNMRSTHSNATVSVSPAAVSLQHSAVGANNNAATEHTPCSSSLLAHQRHHVKQQEVSPSWHVSDKNFDVVILRIFVDINTLCVMNYQ